MVLVNPSFSQRYTTAPGFLASGRPPKLVLTLPVESGDKRWKKLYGAFIACPVGIASTRCGQHASRGRALGGWDASLCATREGRLNSCPSIRAWLSSALLGRGAEAM
jgi:hypothetical protein